MIRQVVSLVSSAVLIFLTGCGSASIPATSQQELNDAPSGGTESAVQTQEYLPTLTKTEDVSITEGITESPAYRGDIRACSSQTQRKSENSEIQIPGVLVFRTGLTLTMLGGVPLTETQFIELPSDEFAREIGFSPNDQWYAFATGFPPAGIPNTIHLVSIEGEARDLTPTSILPELADPDFGGGWTSASWLNDDSMLISIFNGTEDHAEFFLAVVDPFTGNWNVSLIDGLPNRHNEAAIQFSPDMDRVMYVAGPDPDNSFSLVLWDLEKGNEIWRRDNYRDYAMLDGARRGETDTIAWSKDGSFIAFMDWTSSNGPPAGELFVMDRDGKNLQTLHADLNLVSGAYALGWSPTGTYLAAISPMTGNPELRGIVIYEISSNRTIDLCFLGIDDNPNARTGSGRIIWSPNEQYIAYGTGPDSLDEEGGVMLMDIYSGATIFIKHGVRVTLSAWLGFEAWLEFMDLEDD